MKQRALSLRIATLVAVLLLLVSIPDYLFGQQQTQPTTYVPVGSTNGGYYTFVPFNHVNCLWRVGGPDWEKIYFDSQNNFLRESGRRYEKNGVVYVLVYPSERIFVPSGVKTKVNLESIPTFTKIPSPAPSLMKENETPTPLTLFILLILLGIITSAFAYLITNRNREKKKQKALKDAEQQRRATPKKPISPGCISLVGLNKGDVLAALYNASKPQGMGFMHYDPTPMTREEAEELLKETTDFDYLRGRVMKVDLSKDELNPWCYDRDNGQGAAASAIATLANGEVNSPEIQEKHRVGTVDAAANVMATLDKESTFKHEGNGVVLTLGLSDVAHVLEPAVKRAIKDK